MGAVAAARGAGDAVRLGGGRPVLDPFAGGGSIPLGAARLARKGDGNVQQPQFFTDLEEV